MTKNISYHSYLQLDKVLTAQAPYSHLTPHPVHDEMLFITVHQVYELWFKQILHEIDSILEIFVRQTVSDTDIYRIVSRLQRITKIQHLMIAQVKILETMTPMDFLEFRDLLGQASGLQSYQFRLLELKLGIPGDTSKIPFFDMLEPPIQQSLSNAVEQPSLLSLVEKWLERTPFLQTDNFSFWGSYREAIKTMLNEDKQRILDESALTSIDMQKRMQQHEQIETQFEALFDDNIYNELINSGERRISRLATSAALLIFLYRDQPIFQLPFMLLSTLVDIDELLTDWRQAHISMVNRMIGQRSGTGGTSGQKYLAHAAQSRKVFNDLTNLASFLVKGAILPPLPESVKRKLGFHHAA